VIHDIMAAVAPIPVGNIVLLCDSYGGKISDVAADATACSCAAAGTQYCIQYFSSWTRAGDTPTRLAQVAKVYAANAAAHAGRFLCELLRSRFAGLCEGLSGATILLGWSRVKQQYDPDNLFHHAQSVPVSPAGGSELGEFS